MTHYQQRLREELIRRNYAAATIRRYLEALQASEDAHRRRRLDRLGPDDLRRYHASLFADRELAGATVGVHVAALRFFFVRVLKRRALLDELPAPKRHRLPQRR